jgi:uncharacterized membrane protein YhhN
MEQTAIYLLLADFAVVAHALFVLFVVGGGLAVLRWPRLAWLHLPAAVWGGVIEILGWICPLTRLENHFRRLGGESGYSGSFIAQYLEPILYPPGLTLRAQVLMGLAVLVLNAVLYVSLWRHVFPQRD